MAPRRFVSGHNLRSKSPKTPIPSGDAPSPRTPASGRGSKRESPRGTSPKKVKRGKGSTAKKLAASFSKTDDASSDVPERQELEETADGGPIPIVPGEGVPDDPLWVQLEASGDPLMKQIGAHLRASQVCEAVLQNQTDKQAKEAAARQAVRDFEE